MGFVHHFVFAKHSTLPYPTELNLQVKNNAPEWSEFPPWPLWVCQLLRCSQASWQWTEHCSHSGNKERKKHGQGQETESKYLDCVSEYSVCVYEQWWVRWAVLRGVAVSWWCVCVPAVQPDAEACIRSARWKSGERWEIEISDPANKTIILHKGK